MSTLSDNSLLWALTLANIALLAAYTTRQCISRRGIEFNHVTAISLGYFIYWVLPFLIGLLKLFKEYPACNVWYAFFDNIPNSSKELYLCFCLLIYGAFILGTELSCRQQAGKPKPVYQNIAFPLVYLKAQLLVCLLLVGYATYSARQDLFHGYSTIGGEGDVRRSVLISTTGLLEAVAFLYCIKWEERLRARYGVVKLRFRQIILNRAMIAYGISALLVVSTGHRLSALSSLMMLLIYYSVYFQRLRFRSALLTLGLALSTAATLGLVRLASTVNSLGILFMMFVEPIGASQTLLAFLRADRLEMLNFPIFLLSGFINLVPRPLLPDKASLIIKPEMMGYRIYAPQGSFHSFVQFCINFGLIGTVIVWFFIGYGLQKLKFADKSMVHRVAYIMISGFLLTTFFRDDFSGSIVKAILQLSILIPLIAAVSANMLRNYTHPPAPEGLSASLPEEQAS